MVGPASPLDLPLHAHIGIPAQWRVGARSADLRSRDRLRVLARQIGQHLVRPGERPLAIDEPCLEVEVARTPPRHSAFVDKASPFTSGVAAVLFIERIVSTLHTTVEEITRIGGLAIVGKFGDPAVDREIGPWLPIRDNWNRFLPSNYKILPYVAFDA
jgi:hypothetical protein